METQILEGTFLDVKRRLSALPLHPQTRLRVVITETEAEASPFAPISVPTEMRNGLPLLPRRELSEPITLELVKRLLEEGEGLSAH